MRIGRWPSGGAARLVAVVVVLAALGIGGFALVRTTSGDGDRSPTPVPDDGAAARGAAGDPGPPPVQRFSVSFSGDLLMHQPLLDRALANGGGERYDFTPFFAAIRPWVRGADRAVCHLETPLGPGPPATYPIFNTPTGLAHSIKRIGWDACTTASNHSLDQGVAGIEGTVAALDDQGIAHAGSYASKRAHRKPVMLRIGGVRIALLAYTDATNGIPPPTDWALAHYSASDPEAGARAILADARRARSEGADAVVVNLHWGAEYASDPSAEQRELAARLTRSALVTAIVGQGPHVVQPIERLNGKYVVFSEGNLVSNQSVAAGLPAATQDGLIARLRFRARGDRVRVRSVEYVPVWVRPGDYVVLPATPRSDPEHASALRDSRARTKSVVGGARGVTIGSLPAK